MSRHIMSHLITLYYHYYLYHHIMSCDVVLPGSVVHTEFDPLEMSGLCVSLLSLNQTAPFSDQQAGLGKGSGSEEVTVSSVSG
jgi:hypothetical protein